MVMFGRSARPANGLLATLAMVLVGCPPYVVQVNDSDPRYDWDGDGYCGSVLGCEDGSQPGDCDDEDRNIHPGAEEVCGDELDGDCSGDPDDALTDLDGDGDVDVACTDGTDCDDGNPDLNATDTDGDGITTCDGDCDDAEPLASPMTFEICGDGIDNDCDGEEISCNLAGTISLAEADVKIVGTSSWLGIAQNMSMGNAGDLDGDGFDDFMAGAVGHDVGGPNAGAVYVFSGAVDPGTTLADATALLIGTEDYDKAGRSLATVGDIDDDGLGDVLVGANQWEVEGAGKAYLLRGPLEGEFSLDVAYATFTGEADDDRLGTSVASAGDIDGDGRTDLLIGAHRNDEAADNAGAVYLVSDVVPGVTPILESASAKLMGEAELDYAGVGINGPGDLDLDGNNDLVIGAHYNDEAGESAGIVYVAYGPLVGTLSLADTGVKLLGELESSYAGLSIASGDMDADGVPDLLIGASGASVTGSEAGAAYLVHGPITEGRSLSMSDARFLGEFAGDRAGHTVAVAGDVNGDGLDDLLVNAYESGVAEEGAGTTYLLLSPHSGDVNLADAAARFLGEFVDDHAGYGLASAGDLNADGYADIAIGSSGYDDGDYQGCGAIYLLYGGAGL